MLDMLICCCAQQPTLQVAIFVFVAAAAAVVVVSNHDSVRLLSLKHGRKGANSLVDKKSCFQINLLLCLREHRGWLPRLCLLSRRTCFSIWLLERHTQVAIPGSIMSLPLLFARLVKVLRVHMRCRMIYFEKPPSDIIERRSRRKIKSLTPYIMTLRACAIPMATI